MAGQRIHSCGCVCHPILLLQSAMRGQVENGVTPRARSTAGSARDMIGHNNHDCGPCPGTVMGRFRHPYDRPTWQEERARTKSNDLPGDWTQRVSDIPCTNSTSHSIENPPPHGMDHHTPHTAPVGNSRCHQLARCENMRHRIQSRRRLETTVGWWRTHTATSQQRHVSRWARETTREDKGIGSSVGGLTSDVQRVSMEKSNNLENRRLNELANGCTHLQHPTATRSSPRAREFPMYTRVERISFRADVIVSSSTHIGCVK